MFEHNVVSCDTMEVLVEDVSSDHNFINENVIKTTMFHGEDGGRDYPLSEFVASSDDGFLCADVSSASSHDPSIASSSASGELQCRSCDYRTAKPVNLYKHQRIHTEDDVYRRYLCEVCCYRATSSSNLQRHRNTHSNVKPFQCDICRQCFRQKSHLTQHRRSMHEEKSLRCQLCTHEATDDRALMRHMLRQHRQSSADGPPQFACPACSFRAVTSRDLAQHAKIHRAGGNNEMKLLCTECSFVAECPSRLLRHSRTHSDLKPFSCAFCDYRARQKVHVARHLKLRHSQVVAEQPRFSACGSSVDSFAADTVASTPSVSHRRRKPTTSTSSTDDPCTFPDDCVSRQVDIGHSSPSRILDVANSSLVATAGTRFPCSLCSMSFAKPINLYKHCQLQHPNSSAAVGESAERIKVDIAEKTASTTCPVCDLTLSNYSRLLVHMRRHSK